jgi:uncharacterized protein with PIN domain
MDNRLVDDWRLTNQDTYLHRRRLTLRKWWSHREGWGHDHCEFCGRHVSMPLATDDDDAVERGYVTDDNDHWICEECFADFRDRFYWEAADAETP